MLVLTVVTIGMLYTIPVQIAIRNPISGLIFGFGLWEAWKIAKRVRVVDQRAISRDNEPAGTRGLRPWRMMD